MRCCHLGLDLDVAERVQGVRTVGGPQQGAAGLWHPAHQEDPNPLTSWKLLQLQPIDYVMLYDVVGSFCGLIACLDTVHIVK